MAVRVTLLLCGLTGAGKSTLAEALARSGAHVLSCSALVLELAGYPEDSDRHVALLAGRRLLATRSRLWLAGEIARRTRKRLTIVDGPRPMAMACLAARRSAPALLLYLEAPMPELRRRASLRARAQGEKPLLRSSLERATDRKNLYINRRLVSHRGTAGKIRLVQKAVAMLRRKGAQIRYPDRHAAVTGGTRSSTR